MMFLHKSSFSWVCFAFCQEMLIYVYKYIYMYIFSGFDVVNSLSYFFCVIFSVFQQHFANTMLVLL